MCDRDDHCVCSTCGRVTCLIGYGRGTSTTTDDAMVHLDVLVRAYTYLLLSFIR